MSDAYPSGIVHLSPLPQRSELDGSVLHLVNQNSVVSDISVNIEPVDEKPEKEGPPRRIGFKYDPIIEAFLESEHRLVQVEGTGRDAYYLSGQLKKVLDRKGVNSVAVSVRNKEVYL